MMAARFRTGSCMARKQRGNGSDIYIREGGRGWLWQGASYLQLRFVEKRDKYQGPEGRY